ncbi:MAG: YihY/virulence factor BrkB family protein [Sciscionella sp.]|nr:YihY/virulence factor BrkB family protein [Sciscionella sp.]
MGADADNADNDPPATPSAPATKRGRTRWADRGGARGLVARTLRNAWDGNVFSEAAEAAYWQTLSLFPLLLGVLGLVGYIGDWFGPDVVSAVHDKIIGFSQKIFAPTVVNSIIAPTVQDLLTSARGEVASISFLISLYAGSSAMSSFVDAITVAHGQYGVRNEVWQRFYALLLYLVGLVLAVIGLPLLALGPDYLPRVLPAAWRPLASTMATNFYYPVIAVLLVIALATLYKVALPRKLPWHRGLPGAALAMAIFLLSSVGLRLYLATITKTGYTYGALAAPIAFLLMTFFIGLAIVGGAHFNATIQQMWPAKMTRWQRRRWRRLEREQAASSKPAPAPAKPAPAPKTVAPQQKPTETAPKTGN